jgi:outer membrane PBP1 activator LpoA protein
MCFYHSDSKQAIQSITVLFTIIFTLSGCAPTKTSAPVDDRVSTTKIMTDSSPIDEMIAGLDPVAAIALLDNNAANTSPSRAFALMVKATEIAIHHESSQAVDQRLQTLYQRYPGKDKTIQLAILNNRVLLARRKARQVIESIDSLQQQATPAEKLSLQSLKAEALVQAGFPIESVQLRIALDQEYQTVDPDSQSENDTQLWHSLMQVQPELISGHISEIPDTFSGWLELAHVAHRYQFDGVSLNTEIDKWKARNPGHPK